MRMIVLVVLFLSHAGAHAQCLQQSNIPVLPVNPWPTTIAFDPPQPGQGEPVSLVLGPAVYNLVASTQVTVGPNGDILVTGSMFSLAFLPPPAAPVVIPLGALSRGVYRVRVRLVGEGPLSLACSPIDANLSVSTSVPILPGAWRWLSALVLLGAGLLSLRRRSEASARNRQ